MNTFAVVAEDPLREKEALRFAQTNGFSMAKKTDDVDTRFVFGFESLRLDVKEGKKFIPVTADFVSGSVAHRRQFGGGKGQDIAKAVGLSKGFVPHILDVTAGLGRDAFVLATLGAQLTLLERSPIVFMLLHDALQRARVFAENEGDSDLHEILERMDLQQQESLDFLSTDGCQYDVVYLDPMFPMRKKSALVKKEMRAFHDIVGNDEDSDGLLPLAMESARYRVVVKRPRLAPDLNGMTPNYRIEGKSSRFDIYTKKAFPV